MVRPGRESFKRFISIILEQLLAHIDKYLPPDQLLLTEFLSVLQHFEEADYQRNKLSKRFEEYNNRILGTDQYLHTAFLWFSYNYFSNANRLLNVAKFHANSFYEYLAKHLRGNTTNLGVYGLVRKNTPLRDLTWEELQYESNKLLVPLTYDQLQILKIIYASILEAGVYTLDHRKLKDVIINQVVFPKRTKPSDELTRFLTLIDGRWFFIVHPPAFGLTRMVFQFQLQGSTSLNDIIDFHNHENTVISVSDVYNVKNSLNTYLGIILVPTQELDNLDGYLQDCEHQGLIILKELSRITTSRESISLDFYQENIGWFKLPPKKMKQLSKELKSKHPRKRDKEYSTQFIHPPFNPHWNFSQHPLPTRIINLYCRIRKEYSFPNLPLSNNNQETRLSRTEIGLLKQLYYNQIIKISFLSYRLLSEFSLDSYWINLPIIPKSRLKRFLNLLPFSKIYLTKENIHIWANLTPELVHWIENNLNWKVFPIIQNHYPLEIKSEWFDTETLVWKAPKVLLE